MHRVNPFLALTHVITTRELAFDVPVAAVRSSDGVNVNVDLVLTLGIEDPVKFAYTITTGDLDAVHPRHQPGGRPPAGPRHRGAVRARPRVRRGGRSCAPRSTPSSSRTGSGSGTSRSRGSCSRTQLTASLEARRLAAIQLSEEQETFALEERRLNDRANLIALEQESRHKALELEAEAEALRLAKLEERLRAYPTAAHYDLELQRLKVAQQLAGNSRAVVSMGGGDLVSSLLTAQQANGVASSPEPAPDTAPAPATQRRPRPRPRPGPRAAHPVGPRAEGVRRASRPTRAMLARR